MIKRLVLLSLALIVSMHTISSFAAAWRSTNPGGGGAFNSPIITDEGYWVVGSDLGGLYLSKNNGYNWTAIGRNQGLAVTHISSLASHPAGKLLIGTDDGLYVGNSDGKNISQKYSSGYVAAIVVSANPNIVYAAVHPQYNSLTTKIIRSNDAGNSWTTLSDNLPNNLRITAMRAHPVDSSGVWVITGDGRFNSSAAQAWFSSNGGLAWSRLDPNQGDVVDIVYALDPNNLNRMYLTTQRNNQGVFFTSNDTGFNWTELSPNVPSGGLTGIILNDASRADHVRVLDFNYRSGTSTTYFWESYNAGRSWKRRNNSVLGGWSRSDEDWGMGSSFQGFAQTIGYRPDVKHKVLWVNSQFVYKSTNGGRVWSDTVSRKPANRDWISRRVDNVVPVVIEPSKADPNLIYSGYMDLGIWRSDDAGTSWKSLNPGATYTHNWGGKGGNTLSIVADPSRANVVWAQVAGDLNDPLHLLKSTNRGDSWTEINNGLPANLTRLEGLSIAPDSAVNNRWLYVIANGDVYLSKNDGSSWNKVLSCGDCANVWYTESGVYAAGPSNVWRSWQGGVANSWNQINIPTWIKSGWTPGQHWLLDSWTYQGPMDLATRGNQDVWLAIKGKGLFYSANAGTNWTRVYNNPHVRTVAVDPITNEVLLGSSSAMQAGGYQTNTRGVRIHNTGKSTAGWTARNSGLAYQFATFLTVSNTGKRWLISPGQGVMRWQ